MKELSPQSQRMVRALRSEPLSAEDRARLRARVLRTAAAASVAAAATVTTAKASGSALSGAAAAQASAAAAAPLAKAAGVGLFWKIGVASALVVASVPATQTLLVTREEAPRVVEQAPRAHHAPARVAPALALAPAPAPALAPAPAPAPAPELAPVAHPSKPEAVPASSLSAESALLEQALEAARDGDYARARRMLALHALSYPDGLLAPERERVRARLEPKGIDR